MRTTNQDGVILEVRKIQKKITQPSCEIARASLSRNSIINFLLNTNSSNTIESEIAKQDKIKLIDCFLKYF